MDPDGNYVVKPVDERLAELQKSHIPMDHYSFPRDRQVAELNMWYSHVILCGEYICYL